MPNEMLEKKTGKKIRKNREYYRIRSNTAGEKTFRNSC